MPSGSASEDRPSGGDGFTIVELLAAGAVFIVILGITLAITSNLTRATADSSSSPVAFQEARTAFETMTRTISQAVLNTYWDYDSPANPQHYLRASELHFTLGPATSLLNLPKTEGSAIFFQAPLSFSADGRLKALPGVLNSVGFYVSFSQSPDLPNFLADKKPDSAAWRLWMYLQPSEDFKVYKLYNANPQGASDSSWYQQDVAAGTNSHVLANNVILLLIRAGYTSETGAWKESYVYNSRGASTTTSYPQAVEIHQTPPLLNVTMVTIDANTANRLLAASGGSYDLLTAAGGSLFTDAANYDSDLKTLQAKLDARPLGGIPIRYRVFESAISVASSKWSQ